jgi:hypothetical protein
VADGGDNNVFTQIGLIVLVGLSAKNAILIVEFARELEFAGRTPVQAAIEASRLRLRPILMTSLAFIMGVLPWCCPRGRRRDAPRHGRGGVRRDDRCDGLRPVPDPGVLCGAAPPGGQPSAAAARQPCGAISERELHGGPGAPPTPCWPHRAAPTNETWIPMMTTVHSSRWRAGCRWRQPWCWPAAPATLAPVTADAALPCQRILQQR